MFVGLIWMFLIKYALLPFFFFDAWDASFPRVNMSSLSNNLIASSFVSLFAGKDFIFDFLQHLLFDYLYRLIPLPAKIFINFRSSLEALANKILYYKPTV